MAPPDQTRFDPDRLARLARRVRALQEEASHLVEKAPADRFRQRWLAVADELEIILSLLPQEPAPSPALRLFLDQGPATAVYEDASFFPVEASVSTDASGVIAAANATAAQLLGSRHEFLLGKPLAMFVAPEARPIFYERIGQLRTRHTDRFEGWILRMRRQSKPSDVAVTVMRFDAPEAGDCRLQWTLRDISNRLLAEYTLRAERHFADSLIEAIPAAILTVDAAGHVLRWNSYLQTLADGDSEELQDIAWENLFPVEERPTAVPRMARALAGFAEQWTGSLLTRRGGRRTVAWSIKPLLPNPAGAAAILIGHDITDLEQAQEQALRSERLAAIGQLMANLAHESRNALQRSQACLDRLAWRLAGNSEALDLIGRARKAQSELSQLFDEVRSYAGPIQLAVEPCRLPDVWREAWQHVRSVEPGRQTELVEDLGGLPLWVSADAFRLKQVFRNLFDNSFDACADPVRISVRCRAVREQNAPAFEIAVRDNGPGIAAEHRERVFDACFSTKTRGSGLGMPIAKRIMEAHGGSIRLGNGAGGGAEVILTLPGTSS